MRYLFFIAVVGAALQNAKAACPKPTQNECPIGRTCSDQVTATGDPITRFECLSADSQLYVRSFGIWQRVGKVATCTYGTQPPTATCTGDAPGIAAVQTVTGFACVNIAAPPITTTTTNAPETTTTTVYLGPCGQVDQFTAEQASKSGYAFFPTSPKEIEGEWKFECDTAVSQLGLYYKSEDVVAPQEPGIVEIVCRDGEWIVRFIFNNQTLALELPIGCIAPLTTSTTTTVQPGGDTTTTTTSDPVTITTTGGEITTTTADPGSCGPFWHISPEQAQSSGYAIVPTSPTEVNGELKFQCDAGIGRFAWAHDEYGIVIPPIGAIEVVCRNGGWVGVQAGFPDEAPTFPGGCVVSDISTCGCPEGQKCGRPIKEVHNTTHVSFSCATGELQVNAYKRPWAPLVGPAMCDIINNIINKNINAVSEVACVLPASPTSTTVATTTTHAPCNNCTLPYNGSCMPDKTCAPEALENYVTAEGCSAVICTAPKHVLVQTRDKTWFSAETGFVCNSAGQWTFPGTGQTFDLVIMTCV